MYYKSFIAKFEIQLKEDALKNVDVDRIVCLTPTNQKPVETLGCNTTSDLPDWGGTRIAFDTKTGVIQWSFGNSGAGGRPAIYGINPGLNRLGIPNMPDTTAKSNRIFEPAVKLTTRSNPGRSWSATTTSRVLVMDQAIMKSSANSSPPNFGNLFNVAGCTTPQDFTYWCPTPVPRHLLGVGAAEKVGDREYYWFRIGVVATVWKATI
ncbi:hypothetical protein [Sorangium sp. So ce1097]|uniref:hypothetical protein n=1 Tax=Sorangium sp. So ce1097 TaxID=3133330 RepID=UPI003F5E2F5E